MERLQKVLAAAGLGSRRKCEELIVAGRVKVNGKAESTLGVKVATDDLIQVDGKPVFREELAYYLLNKPHGYVTTSQDTHDRPTVVQLVPPKPRVYPVGRLDLDTEGLLLLTNDGPLTHALLHPGFGVEKLYSVWTDRPLANEVPKLLRAGVVLEDGLARALRAKKTAPTCLELTISEGRKRQVRRMLLALGYGIRRLERVQFAFLTLEGVDRGKYRSLTKTELKKLKALAAKKVVPKHN